MRASRFRSVLVAAIALSSTILGAIPDVAVAQTPAAPRPAPEPVPGAEPAPAAQVAPAAPAVAANTATPDEKQPGGALGLAALGTAAGFGLIVLGDDPDRKRVAQLGLVTLVVGPSFGHFYAGEVKQGLFHTGVRVMAAGAIIGGLGWWGSRCTFLSTDCEVEGAEALMYAGLVLGAGSVAYSLIDAPRAARRHNARKRQLMLTPAPVAGPGHSAGFGLQLSGQF